MTRPKRAYSLVTINIPALRVYLRNPANTQQMAAAHFDADFRTISRLVRQHSIRPHRYDSIKPPKVSAQTLAEFSEPAPPPFIPTPSRAALALAQFDPVVARAIATPLTPPSEIPAHYIWNAARVAQLKLHHQAHHSQAEIAKLMNTSRSAVAGAIRRFIPK